MLAVQASIGALNDFVDRHRDAAEKPGKPIPAGLATPRVALLLAGVAGPLGVALSIPSGPAAAVAIGAGLALGYAYDLWLSRTRWSWLPLALALPIVPLHAWLGATGGLPPGAVPLYLAAVGGGAALSLANGLVDLERDARSRRPTFAVAVGARRTWLVHAGLLAVLAAAAIWVAPAVPAVGSPAGSGGGPVPLDVLRALRTWGVAIGLAGLAAGAALLLARSPAARERGWELEAVGVAAAGIGWLAGIAAPASTGG